MFKYVIEDYSKDNGWYNLAKHGINKNIPCFVFDDINEDLDKFISKLNNEDKLLVQSSFQFYDYLKNKVECVFINDLIFTPKNYECINYYKYFGKELLNYDYVVLPAYEIPEKIDFLVDILGEKESKRIFIRPNSGLKPVTGMVYINRYPYFKNDWSFVQNEVNQNELMIISNPKQIKKEYRIVVIDGKIITGSLYREDGFVNYQNIDGNHEHIFRYARYLTALYKPDFAYTIDIAEIDDSLKLIEINSFCHAGLYDCDCEKIIDVINKFDIF